VCWTVFKSQFCGFAAQKYSTKPQLKNCRLARRYGLLGFGSLRAETFLKAKAKATWLWVRAGLDFRKLKGFTL